MFDEGKEPIDIFAEVDAAPKPGAADASGAASVRAVSTVRSGPPKIVFVVVVLVLLGAIGGGVWYAFFRGGDAVTPAQDDAMTNDNGMTQDDTSGATPSDQDIIPTEPSPPVAVCGNALCEEGEDTLSCAQDCAPAPVCGDSVCDATENESSCALDCAPPVPLEPVTDPDPINEPIDSDGDGLSDDQERALGTNPQESDTDSDGLTDREEVQIYGTQPTIPDTDNDGFLDGEEVKNGYNPNGDGRLFQVPSN